LGVFVGRLAAVTVGADDLGAEFVAVGIVVTFSEGLSVEAGLAQLQRSVTITAKYKSDRICLLSARKFFMEKIAVLL
jgi:hypothetical protein